MPCGLQVILHHLVKEPHCHASKTTFNSRKLPHKFQCLIGLHPRPKGRGLRPDVYVKNWREQTVSLPLTADRNAAQADIRSEEGPLCTSKGYVAEITTDSLRSVRKFSRQLACKAHASKAYIEIELSYKALEKMKGIIGEA